MTITLHPFLPWFQCEWIDGFQFSSVSVSILFSVSATMENGGFSEFLDMNCTPAEGIAYW
jgi:hypothetical protein